MKNGVLSILRVGLWLFDRLESSSFGCGLKYYYFFVFEVSFYHYYSMYEFLLNLPVFDDD